MIRGCGACSPSPIHPTRAGLWSTPALGDGVIYAVTHKGNLIVVDQETGEDCGLPTRAMARGHLRIVDNQRSSPPTTAYCAGSTSPIPRTSLVWTFKVGTAISRRPLPFWKGMIYVGNRDGFMYAIGELAETA